MVEATFAIDNKGKNTILTDARAAGIRIANLLLNNSLVLPNNENVFFAPNSRRMEFSNSTTIAIMQQEIRSLITTYIGSEFSFDVYIDTDNNGTKANDPRKNLMITITIGSLDGSMSSLTFKGSSTKDGINLESVINV
jgi:hypothetical protein